MKWILPLFFYFVLTACEQPPAPLGKFEEDLKGTLIEYILDSPNSPPRRSYSLRLIDSGRVVDLVVQNPEFITLQTGEKVVAPIIKRTESLYELVGHLRPLEASEYKAVGTGGIDGSGLSLIRLKTDEFIRRDHSNVPNGLHSREMQTLQQSNTERSLLVVLLNFRSKPLPSDTTISRVSGWVFDGPDNVDKLMNDCTRGQFRFPKQKSRMAPRIYTVNDPNDFLGTSQWLAEVSRMATQAVSQDNIDPAQYDHFVMILPSFSSADNGASGLAPVGPRCGKPCNSYINVPTIRDDYWATEVVAHELGHNLGWSHSGVSPDGGFNVPRPRSSIESEYGDMSGVMGNGQPICPVLINQLAYNWITATETISESKAALLSPMGSPSANTLQGLIVLTQPSAYISYRANVGPDSRFDRVDSQGRGQWANAVYVHVKKGEKGTTAIAKISEGQTFNQGSYSVRFISLKNNVAEICVSINGVPCAGGGNSGGSGSSSSSSSSGGSGGSSSSGGSGPISKPCDSKPCGLNGECVNQVSSYLCQCKPGFVGPKCESSVCESLTISGFSDTHFIFNGNWKRTNDYSGKVAYKNEYAFFYFVPPSKWVIGPTLGGPAYYVVTETNTDAPQTITSWNFNQRTQITCGSGGSGAPVGTNCEGQWSEWTECSSQCGGFQTRTYRVTKPATGNGAICTNQDGQKEQRYCGVMCPLDNNCQGQWSEWSQCSAQCNGLQTRTYRVTKPATGNGTPCPSRDGQREQKGCGSSCSGGSGGSGGSGPSNTPVNCVGIFHASGLCDVSCMKTAEYKISRPAANGGAPCTNRDGDVIRYSCSGDLCKRALVSGNDNTIAENKLNSSIVVLASACVVSVGIVMASLIWKRQRQSQIQNEYRVLV